MTRPAKVIRLADVLRQEDEARRTQESDRLARQIERFEAARARREALIALAITAALGLAAVGVWLVARAA